jgi:hypothetical protein
MSAWLLPRGRSFEFNVNEYNRPDPATQATIDATYFNLVDNMGNHAMTIEEIRMQKRWLDSADVDSNDVVGAMP